MSEILKELLGDDRPVLDPKCPNCGRFTSNRFSTISIGGDVLATRADCSRCGRVEPNVACWSSDLLLEGK